MSRHRAWCFTINNYTSSDEFAVKHLFKNAKYGICGKEIGDEKQTPHLQGYIHLKNPISMKALSKSLTRAYLQVALGTDEQNKDYCSKQGNVFLEVGEPSEGQGKRNDIHSLALEIKEGKVTIQDVIWNYPDMYAKYTRAIKDMFNATLKHRTEPPEVHWRWGKAGTGKTRWVFEKHGFKNVYLKDGTSWWDGYNQQDVILMDDFDNSIPYRTLLRILDRYNEQGQIKGGYVPINSPYIFITCEHPPEYFWSGNTLSQVTRRLTSVQHIK